MSELIDRDAGEAAPSDVEFADGLSQWALSVQRVRNAEHEILSVIANGAVDIIPGVDWSAVLTQAGPGRVQSVAFCGSIPSLLIAAQNELGEGPSLNALVNPEQTRLGDLATEQRWPRFVRRAVELGVGSILCTPLVVDGRIYGSLSLSAAQRGAFGAEAEQLARIFATHAAIALAGSVWRTGMGAALDSRDLIGQAKGMLMERYRLTPDAAFAVLVRASQTTNVKLRDICAQLCSTGDLPEQITKTADLGGWSGS
jgi:transcriptional regulator with GAF, ATPase, and Fis domain